MTVYHGVRLSQVMEAVYEPGRRDGRGEVFAATDELKKSKDLPHRKVGRPRKGGN